MSFAVGFVQKPWAKFAVVVKLMFCGQFVNVGGVTSLAHGSDMTDVAFAKSRLIIFFAPLPLNVI